MGYISLTATVTGNAAGENGGGVYAPAGADGERRSRFRRTVAANTAAIDERRRRRALYAWRR